jgi:hypothetical protein
MKDEQFSIGDEVKWWARSGAGGYTRSHSYGRVEKISDSGVITVVDAFGKKSLHRPSKYGRRYDLEKLTDHERAHAAWAAREPKPRVAWADRGYGNRERVRGVSIMRDVDTPEKLREVIAGLTAIANWWESEPKEKP